jgi:monoamine oxidase
MTATSLSGMYAALLLEERGIDYLLLEARSRLGGRIKSMSVETGLAAHDIRFERVHRYDLGATWYWPAMQPRLAALIERLGLKTFAQHEEGDMLIERSAHRAASRVTGFQTTPPSMRISGGTSSLIEALQARLSGERVRLQSPVRSMTIFGETVTLSAASEAEGYESHEAGRVLLAVPPRLAAATIQFQPSLPSSHQDQ